MRVAALPEKTPGPLRASRVAYRRQCPQGHRPGPRVATREPGTADQTARLATITAQPHRMGCNTGPVPPEQPQRNFVVDPSTGSLYFHRMLAPSWLVNRSRYSQVSSCSYRVIHSRVAFMHVAIHRMVRVACHPGVCNSRSPLATGSLNESRCSTGLRGRANGHQICAENCMGYQAEQRP